MNFRAAGKPGGFLYVFFGMGKNKNWVLLANYLDESLLRNTTAFRISDELGLDLDIRIVDKE